MPTLPVSVVPHVGTYSKVNLRKTYWSKLDAKAGHHVKVEPYVGFILYLNPAIPPFAWYVTELAMVVINSL